MKNTIISLFTFLLFSSSLFAFPSYTKEFLQVYPHAKKSPLRSCTLCHVDGGYNQYSYDYEDYGYDFEAIEPLDSDGDGFSNIEEINALTFPGDFESYPEG